MLNIMLAPFSTLLRHISRISYTLSLNDAHLRLHNVEELLDELKTSIANFENSRKELEELLITAHSENKLTIQRKIAESENAIAEIAAEIAFYTSRHEELGKRVNRLRKLIRQLSGD